MYICPICNKGFEKEESIAKHSLQCWRTHNPNHKSKPAPYQCNTIKQEISEDVTKFFTSFKKGQLCQQ